MDHDLAAWYMDYVLSNEVVKSHVLPSSPSELVRLKVADTISAAMRSAMPLEIGVWSRYTEVSGHDGPSRRAVLSNPTPVMNFLDHLITLLRPCREMWQTFNQYFHLFLEFAMLGPKARTLMMEANIGSLFTKWFCGTGYNNCPFSDYNFPDLRDFFTTLQVIWCGCYQGPNEDSTSPYASDSVLVKALPSFKNELFDHSFFPVAMKHPYNPSALARMACHWCYNDAEATAIMLRNCTNTLGLALPSQKCAKRVVTSLLDIQDELQDARLNYFMSPLKSSDGCGLLGALQMVYQSSDCLLLHLEYLNHCCEKELGFAIAFESLERLDWLDGYCVNKLRKEMRRTPDLFVRFCLEGDSSVLETAAGKEFAEADCTKAFVIIRSLVQRMDKLNGSEVDHYRALLLERRIALLEQASHAIETNKSFVEQIEWNKGATALKCGRFSVPENPFRNGAPYTVVVPINIDGDDSMSDYDVNNVKENVRSSAVPSEAEIASMIAQARDMLGDVDEKEFRDLLEKHHYSLENVVNAMFG